MLLLTWLSQMLTALSRKVYSWLWLYL